MQAPVRFAVVGEGKDEHGVSFRGPMLRPLPEDALRGGLVTLVERLLRERFGRHALPLSWLAPTKNRYSHPPAGAELLVDENLLLRLLDSLLRPIRRSPESWPAAEFVVLSVDFEQKRAFERTVGRIPQELQDRVIPLVFEPEFEVLFTCCQEPLEAACGLEYLHNSHHRYVHGDITPVGL